MDQTSTQEGQRPTPVAEMPTQDSAPQADAKPQAKPAELQLIEEALGREFSSGEEAKNTLRNLNSLVGDQTISKQRKALEKIATQANLSTDELLEVLDNQELNVQPEQTQAETPSIPHLPDDATKRVVRLEVDTFVKDVPEAKIIRDNLFAEALTSGKSISEIWDKKYAPIIDAGRKLGAKKLQSNIEGQPLKATSTASEEGDTKVDFSGINPATGKRWTSKEMEQYIPYAPA